MLDAAFSIIAVVLTLDVRLKYITESLGSFSMLFNNVTGAVSYRLAVKKCRLGRRASR
jgi:hypothetical protein